MSIADTLTALAEWDPPTNELRVRRFRTGDLRDARKLAERAGYRINNTDVVRFALALAAELARAAPDVDLAVVLERVVKRSRSVTGRKRYPFE